MVRARNLTLEQVVQNVRIQDCVSVVFEDAAENFDGLGTDRGDVFDEVLDVVTNLVERDPDEVASV